MGARWRQDVHEFRLSYANDLAALPSSVMPANYLNRFMVMYWDPKHKKASSDGWVYVRFINPDPGAPKDTANTGIWGVMSEREVKACVECHARAADRGYVFSQPLFLFNDNKKADEPKAVKDPAALSNRFSESMKEISPQAIPRIANNLIESFPEWKGRKIMGYMGDFFSGALGEMRPVMNKMAQSDPASIYLIYDRQDLNTFEIASSIKKPGYENCVALTRLRGSGMTEIKEKGNSNRKQQNATDEAYPKAEDDDVVAGPQGVRIQDMSKLHKPSALVYITCGGISISRQNLPLLYTVKDKDGFPSYYFAPAVLDDKVAPAKQ
mgnify:CR=1 FL=1